MKIYHLRYFPNNAFYTNYQRPCAEGGFTLVIDEENKKYGIAVCNPIDKYNKKIGVKIATEKMKDYPEEKMLNDYILRNNWMGKNVKNKKAQLKFLIERLLWNYFKDEKTNPIIKNGEILEKKNIIKNLYNTFDTSWLELHLGMCGFGFVTCLFGNMRLSE